ncbi:hypothetical protein HY642_00825 [Candidatus Woesearchaeota archaeon]|nr:hypothetical protein [Candidatus Woesearchaeota archaeon]
MAEVVMTRAGQITLTKDVREKLRISEGDVVLINVVGNQAIVTKRDPRVFDRLRSFLPQNFDALLKKLRAAPEGRLRRLGILP